MLFQSWRKYSGDAISFFSFLKTELLKKIFSKTSVTFISFGVNNFGWGMFRGRSIPSVSR